MVNKCPINGNLWAQTPIYPKVKNKNSDGFETHRYIISIID
jgi:hypothetical protein